MIDWHSHILPGIDDGSKNVKESLLMLKLLKEQGADTVVATPHFYPDSSSVKEFLLKRKNSYNELMEYWNNDSPKIILGAEVCYYPGVSRLSELKDLCIEKTDILLLEMPVEKWTGYTVNEVLELACSGEFTVIIAHIERYLKFQSKAVIKRLLENGVYMQINAASFDSFFSRKKALKALSDGTVRFIGSDCHNTDSRKPNLDSAFSCIKKEFGEDFLRKIDDFGHSVINQI